MRYKLTYVYGDSDKNLLKPLVVNFLWKVILKQVRTKIYC